MTRSDIIISMIASFAKNDTAGFVEECQALILYEESKKNYTLASKMKQALERKANQATSLPQNAFAITPLDFKRTRKKLHNEKNIQEEDFIQLVEPAYNFDQVILEKSKMSVLKEIVQQWVKKDDLKKYNLTPQNKVLFHGPPGTGKTLSAYALAKELGFHVLYVKFDSLVSSYLGQTGNNLKNIFDFANQEPCVVLLDELDAIGKRRDDSQELGELKRIVISLLQNIDSFTENSLLIACTNHEHLLDSALWRRFDCILAFSLPELPERILLIETELYSRNISLEKKWIEFLAEITHEFSSADIVRIIRNSLRKWVINQENKIQLYLIEEVLRNSKIDTFSEKEKLSLARKLREQSKVYSLSYLSKILGIPKSTLHLRLKINELEEDKL
ncbi:AAA family ATPase [Paenibacillus validus]|uniref:AAA family ATPase n=1 Tax=Paenibacillus validus TaxID=44253 RepID=A0A7X2ZES2_9BACL|nr:ATP-binding protein [Paenibacillus validus]MUG72811.1 AAA family ATPase [Paenibacillus validus]